MTNDEGLCIPEPVGTPENPSARAVQRGVVYAVYAISIVSFFISTSRLVAKNSASESPGIGLA